MPRGTRAQSADPPPRHRGTASAPGDLRRHFIVLLYDEMPRPPLTSLSQAQKRILEVVVRREQRQQPSFVSDLVAELALKAESSLGPTLRRMASLGFLLLQGGGVRGRQRLVVPTEKGRLLCALHSSDSPPAPLRTLPVLGAIPAGPLQEVLADASAEVESLPVDDLLRWRPGDFLLRVRGDSMVGDGILEGDLVLIRPNVEAHEGEIAAVLTLGGGGDCEATLKHFHPRPASGEILLRASNPRYPDLRLPAEHVRLAGVFRGLIRPGAPPQRPSAPPPRPAPPLP
ncbi:MAG: hypothetical protein RLZZ142_1943 [Verrucomicrobiota bacterium]